MPLEYINNFWRSLKILLINYKVELKLRWAKYCALAVAGVDNTNKNPNNIFTMKDKFYAPTVIKNYQNILAKDLKYQFVGMNIKQKLRIKIKQINIDIFLNQTIWELTDC